MTKNTTPCPLPEETPIMTEKNQQQSTTLTLHQGRTTFLVNLHFDETSTETIEKRVKDLIRKEASADS